MAEKNNNSTFKLSFNIKSLIIFIIIVIGIILLVPKLITAEQAIKLIFHIKKIYVITAIAAEIISYVGAAWLLGSILSRLGYKIKFIDRFRISSIAAFAIHFFPLGAVGENALDYYFLKKRDVAPGSILLMFILRGIFTYLSFLILFVIALIMVPVAPHLPFSPRLVSLVILALIIIGIIYLITLYFNKDKFRNFWLKLIKFANWWLKILKRSKIKESQAIEVFDDIYQGVELITKQKRFFVFSVFYGLIYWLGDILCFFFIFLSFGYLIKLSILIFAYGMGTIIGLVSMIPGGIGVTEGMMSVALSGMGVPLSLALMSILVFRFFSFWIWIPIGLHSYVKLTKERDKDEIL